MEHDFGSGRVPPHEQVQVYGWMEVAHPADVPVIDSAGTLPDDVPVGLCTVVMVVVTKA
mgnify:CR=1 FL=1